MLQDAVKDLMAGSLAPSTMSGYQAAVSRFREFQSRQGYKEDEITEKVLLHYVAYLHSQQTTHSVFCQIKPAISLLLQLKSGQATVFTDRVDRFIEAGKRKAVADKQGVKKATEVKFGTLQKMVREYILPHENDIFRVDVFKLRTITRVVVEYYTFCRGADYRQLQARNIEEVGEDLLITFPKAKNDQLHEGRTTMLAANQGDTCPVRLVKLYYKRFGLKFGEAASDTSYLHCRIRKHGGRHYADKKHQASMSLAAEELKGILAEMGEESGGVSDKSFKMLGVTRTLEAGASAEQVSLHGRWITMNMPLRYKHNSMGFKKQTASLIPTD